MITMEIMLFFGLFFVSIFLTYLAFSRDVVYLGVLGAIMMLFLGIHLAAGSNIQQVNCFSNIATINTSVPNYSVYTYSGNCTTTTLPLDRNNINAIGFILILIVAGMIADMAFRVNETRRTKVNI